MQQPLAPSNFATLLFFISFFFFSRLYCWNMTAALRQSTEPEPHGGAVIARAEEKEPGQEPFWPSLQLVSALKTQCQYTDSECNMAMTLAQWFFFDLSERTWRLSRKIYRFHLGEDWFLSNAALWTDWLILSFSFFSLFCIYLFFYLPVYSSMFHFADIFLCLEIYWITTA